MKDLIPYLIISLALVIALIYVDTEVVSEPKTITVTETVTEDCPFTCLVEKRTEEIYNDSKAEFMETSRIRALTELNTEAQEMVYQSPYVTLTNDDNN